MVPRTIWTKVIQASISVSSISDVCLWAMQQSHLTKGKSVWLCLYVRHKLHQHSLSPKPTDTLFLQRTSQSNTGNSLRCDLRKRKESLAHCKSFIFPNEVFPQGCLDKREKKMHELKRGSTNIRLKLTSTFLLYYFWWLWHLSALKGRCWSNYCVFLFHMV